MSSPDHELFYDRNCGFCRRMLSMVLAWDEAHERRLKPVALQSAIASERLGEMTDEERMASWHLRKPDGSVVSGGAALPDVLNLVGRKALAAHLMRRMPGLTDRGYRWVAGHRTFVSRATKRWPMFHTRPDPRSPDPR